MTIDEMIAVLQAAKAKRAEWRYKKSDSPDWSPWLGPESSTLNLNEFDYRVKPEPREWWLNGCLVAYCSRQAALDSNPFGFSEPIKVREVL